jgi:hypothetical protein
MGWKNRLADLEFVCHGTPRLKNLTGTRARTEPLMAADDWSPRRRAQSRSNTRPSGHHSCGGTFPLFLTYVNSVAETGPPAAGCSQQQDEQFQGFGAAGRS